MSKCKKIFLCFFSGAAFCIIIYYAVLYSLPLFINLNDFKQNIFDETEKQTGFKVSVEDITLKRSLTPNLNVHLYHTIILYPDNEIFLKLKEADLSIKLLPLLFKKIIIKDAVLERPIINTTLYKDFSTSIEKYVNITDKINTRGFYFNGIASDTVCNNYKIKIKDETTDKLFYFEGDKLLIKDVHTKDKLHLIFDGTLFENGKKYINYDIDILAYLNNVKKQFTFSPFKPIIEYDVKGSVYGKLIVNSDNSVNGNLNLSDFSLKLDNTILTDNNAKLILKNGEIGVSAELHTSKNDIANITGKIGYAKKKFIDITTKADNVKIEKLFKIVDVVSESLNIPNKYKDIKIKGTADADFNISSDFKKLKSNGNIRITDAEIIHKDFPYKINRINSRINLSNNKIILENAAAYINSTPIKVEGNIAQDVDIDIKAYSNDLDLKTVASLFLKKDTLPVDISGGKLSFISYIKGKPDKSLNCNTDINIKNLSFFKKSLNNKTIIDNVSLKIKNISDKYNGDILISNLKTSVNKKNISAKEIKMSFDDKKITIPLNKINLVSSSVTISGIISNYQKQPEGQINYTGNINAQDIADVLSFYIKEPYKAEGVIKTSGNVNIKKDNTFDIVLQMYADKDNYLSYLVIKELLNKPSVLKLNANIKNEVIDISELSLYQNAGKEINPQLKITGEIINGKELFFNNLRILIPESLSARLNFFGGEEISLKGDVFLNNTLKNLKLNGIFNIHKLNIKRLLTSIKNAEVKFTDNNIRITAPEIEINNSKINIIADLKPVINNNIFTISDMQLNSVNLDLNTFFEMIKNEMNPFSSSQVVIEKGTATINSFNILDLKSNDISADFSLKNNILEMTNITAKAYNGIVYGNIKYDINHAMLGIDMSGKELDIKESLYDLCKIKDNLAGKSDFTAKVNLITGEYKQVLKSLSGEVVFNATNGRMGTLGKFEYYLYAQNLLYHGILNATLNRIADTIAPENTAKFKQSMGKLILKDGYLITDEIKTIGPNMSLYIKGRHNLLTNMVNIDIYGRISDEIKSKLGSFGDVSLSELINGQIGKKHNNIQKVPQKIITEIPELYKYSEERTNTFKVNIYGDMNSLSSINSFVWIISDENSNHDKLPEFTEIIPEL